MSRAQDQGAAGQAWARWPRCRREGGGAGLARCRLRGAPIRGCGKRLRRSPRQQRQRMQTWSACPSFPARIYRCAVGCAICSRPRSARQAVDCRRQHSGKRSHGAAQAWIPRRISHGKPHRRDRHNRSGEREMTITPTRQSEGGSRQSKPRADAECFCVRQRKRHRDQPLYTAQDVLASGELDASPPGEPPFTRGIHPLMYRTRPWTMRQYTGFANAADTNQRFKYLIDNGQTGLNVAFDLPTQCGYRLRCAEGEGEVGRVGMAVDTLRDSRSHSTASISTPSPSRSPSTERPRS